MLKIAPCNLVSHLIERYQIWSDAQSFYTGSHTPKVKLDPAGIPCYLYNDVKQINQHTNSLIAIDCLTEGVHSLPDFVQYNKSNRYLIFANGTWDRNTYDLGINYQLVQHNFFLFDMADTYNSPNKFCYYLDKTRDYASAKPYVFISTTGNVRPERDYLVEKLMTSLDYDNFLFRYSGQDINGSGAADVISVEPGNFDPYSLILDKYYHNVSQTLPINLYNQGHFNLTVETDLSWADSFFLTEKTIKNLVVGMPFVSVATTHFLKNLRSLGFETYSSLWDESYDDILDYYQRVDCIVKLCNNLGSFNWAAAQKELQRIGEKNQLNFLRLNKLADREFLNLEKAIELLA